MRTELAPSIIHAAAKLLVENPDLTNAELLRRLAVSLGPAILREVPVTHSQRRLRDPAMRLAQSWIGNGRSVPPDSGGGGPSAEHSAKGEGGKGSSSGPVRPEGEDERGARPSVNGRARARSGRRNRATHAVRTVDEALVEAFTLGVEARSRPGVVDAFGELDELRRRVRRVLGE